MRWLKFLLFLVCCVFFITKGYALVLMRFPILAYLRVYAEIDAIDWARAAHSSGLFGVFRLIQENLAKKAKLFKYRERKLVNELCVAGVIAHSRAELATQEINTCLEHTSFLPSQSSADTDGDRYVIVPKATLALDLRAIECNPTQAEAIQNWRRFINDIRHFSFVVRMLLPLTVSR